MIYRNSLGIFQSTLFDQFQHVVGGFTSRANGDMQKKTNKISIMEAYGGLENRIYSMEQVHGNKTTWVNSQTRRDIPSSDGLLYIKEKQSKKYPFLFVHTADCVPIIFFDPIKDIIAIVHAGWRGTHLEIVKNIITKFKSKGAKPSDIYVAIGPHIGLCCYSVDTNRASKFTKKYSREVSVYYKNTEKWFIDLGKANYIQLISEGIMPEHIDTMVSCTCCQKDQYFSFRRFGTGGDQIGAFIGYI